MINNNENLSKLHIGGLLQKIGKIKNVRLRLSDSNDDIQSKRPPLMVWWFTEEEDEVNEFIADVIKNFPWKDEWILETNRKNAWCLCPKRIIDIEKEKQCKNFDAAVVWLMENEPEFGYRTNQDLRDFVEYFRIRVREYLAKKAKS